MKKLIFGLFFLGLSTWTFAQNYEWSIGQSNYRLYAAGNSGNLTTDLHMDNGYSFGLAISKLKLDHMNLRLAFKLDYNEGSINTSYAGAGGTTVTDLDFKSYALRVGVYPVNVSFFEHLKIDLGAELSYLFKKDVSGERTASLFGQGLETYVLKEDAIRSFQIGFSNRVAYEIHLNNWKIIPQFTTYIGLLDEFNVGEGHIRSLRSYFELGISRNLSN
jgi:hypothetical protein